MTLSEILRIAMQIELLRQQIKNADTPEKKMELAAQLAELLEKYPELSIGGQRITPEDIARDVETFNLTQG